jgi:hypothetical protein
MTGLFNPPLVAMTNLEPEQKARGAALLIARQARPESTVAELITLADYIIERATLGRQDHLPHLFAQGQMDLDPVHSVNREANFGDLDSDPSAFRDFRTPLDRTGEDRDRTFQGDPEEGIDIVHLQQPDGRCVISVNGQGHLPCPTHSPEDDGLG